MDFHGPGGDRQESKRHPDQTLCGQAKNTWSKSWSSMEDLVVLLERNLYGHPLEDNSRKSYCSTVGRRFPIGNAYSLTEKKDYSCLCMWMTKKLAGKKQNLDPMWKVLMKDVDMGEPTSFLDHVYSGCTQRERETSKDIVDNNRNTVESGITAGATEKVIWSGKT